MFIHFEDCNLIIDSDNIAYFYKDTDDTIMCQMKNNSAYCMYWESTPEEIKERMKYIYDKLNLRQKYDSYDVFAAEFAKL